MSTIVINIKTNEAAKLLLELAKQMGGNGKLLSKSEQEDLAFGEIMNENRTRELVSKESILKVLKGK